MLASAALPGDRGPDVGSGCGTEERRDDALREDALRPRGDAAAGLLFAAVRPRAMERKCARNVK
jgi:hypothetical protein